MSQAVRLPRVARGAVLVAAVAVAGLIGAMTAGAVGNGIIAQFRGRFGQ